MKPQHTATPWKLHVDGKNILGAGSDKRFIAETSELLSEFANPYGDTTHLANAAFIVRACNNYQKLIEALKDVRVLFKDDSSTVEMIDEVLAEAKK